MGIVNNGGYNNPQLGAAFSNLQSLFQAPSAQELVASNAIGKNIADAAQYQEGVTALANDPNTLRLVPLYKMKIANPADEYAKSIGATTLANNPNNPVAIDAYNAYMRGAGSTFAYQASQPQAEGTVINRPPSVAAALGLPQTQTNEKTVEPVLKDVRLADGSTQPTWVKPGDATGVPLGAPAKPDAVDPTKLAEERAKNVAKQEADAASRGQTAELMIPHIDRATRAYQTLVDQKAIGPVSASGPSRTIGGVFGTQAEAARQEFEAAKTELELAKSQISMKGQGSISDSERRILALTLPRLDAADPSVGLRTLQQMRDAAAGSMTKAGKTASAAPGGGAAPVRVQTTAEARALPRGTPIILPDGTPGVVP